MLSIIEGYRKIRENPFPHPNPKPFVKAVLIGREEQLENISLILEEVNSQSSVVILTGFPGYGKSQFLNHLDYLFDKAEFGKNSIFCKIDNLPEEVLRGKDLEQLFLRKLKQERKIDQSVKTLTEEINKRKKLGELNLIVFAIDSVDEYLRYLEQISKNPKVLFSSLRMLFGQVPRGLCIILACTHDVTIVVREILNVDRTYARRTKWITPDLSTLNFEQLKSIPSLYLKEWVKYHRIKTPIQQLFSENALYTFYKASDGSPGDFVRCCNRSVVLINQQNINIPMGFNDAINVVQRLSRDLNLTPEVLEDIYAIPQRGVTDEDLVIDAETRSLYEFLTTRFDKNGIESSFWKKSLILSKDDIILCIYSLKEKVRTKKRRNVSASHARDIISVFAQKNPSKILVFHSSSMKPEWEYRGKTSAKKLIAQAKIKEKVKFFEVNKDTPRVDIINSIVYEFKGSKDPIVRHDLDETNLSEFEKSYIRNSIDSDDFSAMEAKINLLYENRLRVFSKEKLVQEYTGNWFAKAINTTPSIKNNPRSIQQIKKNIKKDLIDVIANDLLDPSKTILNKVSNPLVYLTLGQLRELIKKNGKNKWFELCNSTGIKPKIEESMKNIENVRNSIKHGRSIKSTLKERYLIEVIDILDEIHKVSNENELQVLIKKCKNSPYLSS